MTDEYINELKNIFKESMILLHTIYKKQTFRRSEEKPVFNTRIYSNFVQCKPVFLNSSTEIYKVYLDDISLRFQAGITVKHNFKGKYDLHDEYENYETIVMEE